MAWREKLSLQGLVKGLVLCSIIGGFATLAGALALNAMVKKSAAGLIYEEAGEVPKRKVAIVLGARVYADGSPSPVLEDRLYAALQLYRKGRVTKILVSGDHGQRGYDEVNAMHAWLLKQGVPVADVFLDHAGFRTYDTMARAARVFEIEDAVICTQRFHLDRSLFLAHRAGIDAVGLVADRRVYIGEGAFARREFLARALAVIDAYHPMKSPKFLGPPIPIDGDARKTHDRWTQVER